MYFKRHEVKSQNLIVGSKYNSLLLFYRTFYYILFEKNSIIEEINYQNNM